MLETENPGALAGAPEAEALLTDSIFTASGADRQGAAPIRLIIINIYNPGPPHRGSSIRKDLRRGVAQHQPDDGAAECTVAIEENPARRVTQPGAPRQLIHCFSRRVILELP